MVEANRVWLIELLAGLFVTLGASERVPRVLRRRVQALLVPMESALRRLILVMARDLTVTLRAATPCPGNLPKKAGGESAPVFQLTDTPRDPDPAPRSTRGHGPRILFLDEWTPKPESPAPRDDDLVDTGALRRRMAAMQAALDDLPGQARRMARWYARRDRTRAAGKHARPYPIRSGRAPGHLEGGKREVDKLLAICHDLALHCRMMVEKEKYGQ